MKYLSTILSIAAIVIALVAYTGNKTSFGDVTGTTNYGNLGLSGTLAVTGATTLSSTLTQTTSNTATSTAEFGCVESTATSTASPIKVMYIASTTIGGSVVSTAGFGGGTAQGLVLWGFGNCP